jgi:hypothetical protein
VLAANTGLRELRLGADDGDGAITDGVDEMSMRSARAVCRALRTNRGLRALLSCIEL